MPHERLTSLSQTAKPATVDSETVLVKESSKENLYTGAFGRLPLQRKLTVGAVDDPMEEEADNMADKVMRMPESDFIQRKCSHCEQEEEAQRKHITPFIQRQPAIAEDAGGQTAEEDEEEDEADTGEGIEMTGLQTVQTKQLPDHETETARTSPLASFIQRKDNPGEPALPGDVSNKIQSTRGKGDALPEPTKVFMEDRFGANFSNVTIHTGNDAAYLSNQLNAQAFAVGNDIYFNSGKFAPSTDTGKRLIAHELTHTIQQGHNNSKATPTVQRSFWSKIKSAAGAVWGGIKTAGKWIGKGAKKVWGAIKWFGGQLIDKIAGVFQRLAYWFTQLPTRVYRLLSGLWQGLKTFKPWTLNWWKSLAEADTWKNFLKWVFTAVLNAAEVIGVGEAYQTLEDIVKFNTRTLKESEIRAGKSIFGHTINFDFIRVDEAAVLGPAFTKRAYTSFHTINTWGKESLDVMVHEMTHVWQYENAGAIYMPQALHAQFFGEGYDYKDVAGLQARQLAGKGLMSFNREQQAQIVQDFYKLRQFGYASRTTAGPADIPLYASFVKEVSSLSMTELTTPI